MLVCGHCTLTHSNFNEIGQQTHLFWSFQSVRLPRSSRRHNDIYIYTEDIGPARHVLMQTTATSAKPRFRFEKRQLDDFDILQFNLLANPFKYMKSII